MEGLFRRCARRSGADGMLRRSTRSTETAEMRIQAVSSGLPQARQVVAMVEGWMLWWKSAVAVVRE